ncbi:cytochrome c [Pontibacter ummariensis]|uniref:Cytochrome c n=1 Tax=Pontibacter ummariensis TaxID=1610492 RepID=A0A239KSX6_9BACT|nr:c-type cytochrome [Pontibacter ummariensis]PRY05023.1 cytochrome c [Pontibacter ummariensis]SNT21291.1 Cytochrome c [Pontibacter ummariensis]
MKTLIFKSVLLGSISFLQFSCTQSTSHDVPNVKPYQTNELLGQEQVLRGEYLVTIMGCNDCHSPKVYGPNGPVPDAQRLLSGHPANYALAKVDTTLLKSWVMFNSHSTAVIGPWGVSFAANITSDPTGIGTWTEEQFFKAMREGKAKGLANNRNLLPPMPWQTYSRLKDDDLRAILAYLKSTKPVKNVVPPPMPLQDISS